MPSRLAGLLLLGALACAGQGPAPSAGSDGSAASDPIESAWPHRIEAGDQVILVHEPEVDSWVGTQLSGRAAVSVGPKADEQTRYGVIWFSASTKVDKAVRLVTLDDVRVTRSTLSSETDSATLAALGSHLETTLHTIALDRLQASLLIAQSQANASTQSTPQLKNDVPRILVSDTPAVLILVDGKPQLRAVPGTPLFRIINTRALLALDPRSARYELWLGDRWIQARSLDGPWSANAAPDSALAALKASIAESDEADPLDDVSPDVQALLRKGEIPSIYVSTGPAELLQIRGKPELVPVEGTDLLVVGNTSSDIFVDAADGQTYVLISGRWFSASSLDGPWSYVEPGALPRDFAEIPAGDPKARVLASVAGTAQAEEAIVANQIPQTATIERSKVQFEPRYDGAPKFEPIVGTSLQAAANTPSAVLEVTSSSYYGCENGVWFAASSPSGPWSVAAAVPDVVYTIPPSSRLYGVTFVRVYESTPAVVLAGYTPGYYGSYVAPGGVVVYGTGYTYPPWIGDAWIGAPCTYGFGAGYVWGASSGFVLGYTAGELFDPWWGPWGWNRGWGWRHDGVRLHTWAPRNFQAYNRNLDAYRRWGGGAIQPLGGAIHVGPSGRVPGVSLLTGRDGSIYRPSEGGWQRYDAGGWRSLGHDQLETARSLERQAQARGAGDVGWREFQSQDFGRQPFGARTMGGQDFGHGFGGGGVGGFHAGSVGAGHR